MRFDIYGKYQLEVVREGERWVMYKLDVGRRSVDSEFVIPGSLQPDQLATYLDDMLHELAGPGDVIRQID